VYEEEGMNNLNSILIEGNLVKDPELSYTPKGTAVCKFTVACNRAFKQDDQLQKEVSFFDVSTWTRLAEVCAEYLKKGRGVRVVGRLKQDKWSDADGKPHSRIYIVAEHVEFKPQIKKDGEPAVEEEKPAEGAEEEQEGVKEAVSF
jgi:single-strand DNA-binding protein